MVSTRGHPKDFPEPDLTPSRTSTPSRLTSRTSSSKAGGKWAHQISNVTLVWLGISLPLVAWDTGYVLLRPHSMPGGSLHWPLWVPYELYGKIDYIYGWKAFDEHNGFTAAQGALNAVESAMYLYYLYIMYAYGKRVGSGRTSAKRSSDARGFFAQRSIEGRYGAVAALVVYTAAIMTLSKTVLYWLNEYFSGFENIGHNTVIDLVFMWIIPNGAWLVLPTYIIYEVGGELLESLSKAAGASGPVPDDTIVVKRD
ncbi:hypothetical protein B7463_g9402, partial [Scytalidium lignicola]